MRFISEDNKVFNTIEECQEHEANLKKESVKLPTKLKLRGF